jgi:AraC-like DNA-binding protein
MYQNYIPKSKILAEHIDNFSILKEFTQEIRYLAFPQIGSSMAFLLNSDVKIQERSIFISKSKTTNEKILLLGKYLEPIELSYKNFVPEIAINFKALGLNYFFKNLDFYQSNNIGQIINQEIWLKTTKQIFHCKNNDERISILEEFLLSQFIDKDLNLMKKCIKLIDDNPLIQIAEIVQNLNLTRKSLNRSFQTYLGRNPSEYKKIIKFRKAISSKFDNPTKSLTNICFESDFYDSPHFTREFKKLTKMNPRDFFSKTTPVSDIKFPYSFNSD